MRRDRRGMILIAVIVAVAAAILLVTAVAWSARAERSGRAAATESVQGRAASWSGIQAVMEILADQRAKVLAGDRPDLNRQYELFTAGREVATLRILPIDDSGALLLAEAGRLDANEADEETLTSAGIDSDTVARIMSARGASGGRLASIEEIFDGGAGLDPALVYGENALGPSTLAILRSAAGSERGSALLNAGSALKDAGSALRNAGSRLRESGVPGRGAAALDDTSASPQPSAPTGATVSRLPLAEMITVYGVEPALRMTGEPRIVLDSTWQETLAPFLAERFGDAMPAKLKTLAGKGLTIDSDAALIECVQKLGIEPAHWNDVLDTFTAEPGTWRRGRVDINEAPIEVLSALAGFPADKAERLVRERGGLGDDEKQSITWPLERGVLTAEELVACAKWISVRSFFWRVRVAVGFASADQPDGVLNRPALWEIVVDLTSERPRLAGVREITLAPIAARLLRQRPVAPPSDSPAVSGPTSSATGSTADSDSPTPEMVGPEPSTSPDSPTSPGPTSPEQPQPSTAPAPTPPSPADATPPPPSRAPPSSPPPVGRYRPR